MKVGPEKHRKTALSKKNHFFYSKVFPEGILIFQGSARQCRVVELRM